MKVILSANVSHYYWAALALQRAGYLGRYIASITPSTKYRWLPNILPSYWQKKLKGREMPAIDPALISSLWLPEGISKILERSRLISTDRANWINNYLYDWLAKRLVTKCDVFHFVSSIGLYSARKAKKLGAIIICDERTEHPDFQRKILKEEYANLGLKFRPPALLYDKKIKAEYALSDYIIVPSSYAKRTFVDTGFDATKIFVVPYGFDVSQFKPLGKKDDVFRIIFSGQVIPRKGVHYLLQAFEELKLSNSELLLVGNIDKSMSKLLNSYVSRNKNIKTTGNVPKIDLVKYYGSASVFVLPSLSDAQPLVAFEAMACGLPVIVTENTGTQEIIREGKDGFVIPIRDVGALKEKIRLLYEDGELLKRMGQAARNRIQEFTWGKYEERLLDVYAKIQERENIP
jgi:glycosyltransferase involved in cell wall biosynthesis